MTKKISTVKLIDGATATGAGAIHEPWGSKRTFHFSGSVASSTGAATARVQVSNDGVNFIDYGSADLSLTLGTSVTSDKVEMDAPWRYVRGDVKTISGTGATVNLTMGCEV